jgi:hypothetical protein
MIKWCIIDDSLTKRRLMRRVPAQDYHLLAQSKNGKCVFVGSGVDDNQSRWKCYKKHTWPASYSSIRRGSWCPYCAGTAPITPDKYHALAKSKGGKCLFVGKNTQDSSSKWKCKVGHIWNIEYGHIQQGGWCPKCAHSFPKTRKDYITLAKSNNGKCLFVGKNVLDGASKWKCHKGHIWNTAYSCIQSGTWCPRCAGKIALVAADYHKLAKNKGGKCLLVGKIARDNSSKWKCIKGHEWNATYDNVHRGHWCPNCSQSIIQELLTNIVKKIFPGRRVKSNVRPFGWLRYKRKLQVDIWLPAIKLAIEYDGSQHFNIARFSKSQTEQDMKEALKALKKRDRLKDRLINEHKDEVTYFVRFNYKEKIDRDYVVRKLEKYNVPIPKIKKEGGK